MEPNQPIHEPDYCMNCENFAHRLAVVEWGEGLMGVPNGDIEYDVLHLCKHHHAELVVKQFQQPTHAKDKWFITHSEVLPDYTDDGTLIPEHCFALVSTENPVGVVVDTVEVIA